MKWLAIEILWTRLVQSLIGWRPYRNLALQRGFVTSELYIVIAIVGILSIVAVPAYLDYRERVFVHEMVAGLRQATDAVDAHWRRTRSFPERLGGYSRDIQSLAIDQKSGVITATLQPQDGKFRDLAGKTLVSTPTLQKDGTLRWTCRSPDIPLRKLPNPCR